MNTQNLIHVTRKNESATFVCGFGSRCNRFKVKISKKQTTASSCPHEHIARVLTEESDVIVQTTNIEQPIEKNQEHIWIENTSKYLYKNAKLDLTDNSICKLESKVLKKSTEKEWPKLYQVRLFLKVFIVNLVCNFSSPTLKHVLFVMKKLGHL